MKALSKAELDQEFGKSGMWNTQKTVNLFHYMGGIEAFDEKVDIQNYFTAPNIADFIIRPSGLEIKMMHNFRYTQTGVPFNRIISVNLEDKEQIIEKVDRSVVGRAIIGGLIFGPVGAIIGGMTGLKQGQRKVPMPDLVLSISIGDSQEHIERVLLFSCPFKKRSAAEKFFAKAFPDKFALQEA